LADLAAAVNIGVLLAAGAGSRFGGAYPGAKLDQLIDGVAVGVRSFENLAAAVDHVVVVVRNEHSTLASHARSRAATVIVNDAPDRGMGHSLSLAANHALTTCDEALFIWATMADLPFIKNTTFNLLACNKSFHDSHSALKIIQPIFVCSRVASAAASERNLHCDTRVGHPVIFGRAHWQALAALDGDEGARSVVRANREHMITVETDDEGVWRDIDTPSDLSPNQPG
jgi:molybdenum cofactor cytidylyltransferase